MGQYTTSTKLKRTLSTLGAGVGMAAMLAVPTMAVGAPGYWDNPGRQQAVDVGAQCGTGAGSGAFGAFGPGDNWAGGANGPATGDANSAICGNQQ